MGRSQAVATGPTGPEAVIAERKALGAWYTPPALVRHVVERAVTGPLTRGGAVRVLDPACGDGRFLLAAATRVRELGGRPVVTGIDIDGNAVDAARRALTGIDAEVILADALAFDWSSRRFDVVVGNPPFLNQMARASTRGGSSRHGGGPYADAAVEFLAMALGLTRKGHVAMVLPMSILSSRDAAPVRGLAVADAAMRWAWWSETAMFDAEVRTCALGFDVGAAPGTVRRATGADFAELAVVPDPGDAWSLLLAGTRGVPPLGRLGARGTAGDVATFGANFRDEYYGMVGAVGDEAMGPPLVTSGLIDPGASRWGERPARFAKQRYAAPRLDLDALTPRVRAWAQRHLRPKVLVANQTAIVEAVVDADGEWVPSVPVVNGVPHDPSAVWELGAVLTSPVASAWVAERAAGSGLSARGVRLSPSLLAALPWPADATARAVLALRAGDVAGCGAEVMRAYGVVDDDLLGWWLSSVERAIPSPVRR